MTFQKIRIFLKPIEIKHASSWLQRIFITFFTACVCVGCNSEPNNVLATTEANYSAKIKDTAEACKQEIKAIISGIDTGAKNPKEISLLNWNIEKGENPGWDNDLYNLSRDADFVLLQEALLTPSMQSMPWSENHWFFTSGYKTPDATSGLITHSREKPLLTCSLRMIEPWLRTPKSTSLALVDLGNRGYPLMIVNQHSINFTIGIKAVSKQFETVANLIHNYPGPVIFAGDLNTWNKRRIALLRTLIEDLELQPVNFPNDLRSKKMGKVVDYILVKGMHTINSQVLAVNTSDHNPIMASFLVYE